MIRGMVSPTVFQRFDVCYGREPVGTQVLQDLLAHPFHHVGVGGHKVGRQGQE
jgi:hypothetical protein